MKMKNILRENMRRFNTKNLNEAPESSERRDTDLMFISMTLKKHTNISVDQINTNLAVTSRRPDGSGTIEITQEEYNALKTGSDSTQTSDAGMYATSVLNTSRFSEAKANAIRSGVQKSLSQSQYNRIVNSDAYKYGVREIKRIHTPAAEPARKRKGPGGEQLGIS